MTNEVNDNPAPAAVTISFTDLVAQSGIDEDVLMQRLAGILDRRAGATKELEKLNAK